MKSYICTLGLPMETPLKVQIEVNTSIDVAGYVAELKFRPPMTAYGVTEQIAADELRKALTNWIYHMQNLPSPVYTKKKVKVK